MFGLSQSCYISIDGIGVRGGTFDSNLKRMFGVLGVKCTVASLPTNHALQQYPTVHVVTHPCCLFWYKSRFPFRQPGSQTPVPHACSASPIQPPRVRPPTSGRTAGKTCLKDANHFPFPSFQGQLAASLPCQTGHCLNYCHHATLISEGGIKSYHIHLLPSAPTPPIAIRILVSRTHLLQGG
jgi:hypothetical protein